jgi:hypothetical protein
MLVWNLVSRIKRRTLFEPKRDEVTGGWRNNEELHNFHSLLDIIRIIKSRRMRWAGHATHMGVKRKAYQIFNWKPNGRDYSEDLVVDGRIILRRT